MFRKLAAFILCGAAATAGAADNGFYVGLGASQSSFDIPGASDDTDNGFKGLIGFRLLDSFAVEASYQDHGEATLPTGIACIALVGVPCPTNVGVKATTASAFAVGFLDFPVLDLFGKVGVANMDMKVRAPGLGTFNLNDSKTEFAWGAGLQAHFGSLGARAEFEQFKLPGTDEKLNAVSLSFVYTFL